MRLLLLALLMCVSSASGETLRWKSPTLDAEITGTLLLPDPLPPDKVPTAVYLQHLAQPRVGRTPDDVLIANLREQGMIVLVLDYAHHERSQGTAMHADLLQLRTDIAGKTPTLLRDQPVDVDRLFIVPAGYRLRQNVIFARDGERELAMDVLHPSDPAQPVGAVIEFSCDNVNRMGSFSLLYCQDTLMEGAALAGFVSAMADHPVAPPYKGLDDPMPPVLHRAKAAVRTMRSLQIDLSHNNRVAALGFSRGGPIAALLAATNDRADLEADGTDRSLSSAIQAAVVHGNRYDYLHLLDTDPMLARFENAWGPRDAHPDRWAMHGAAYYLTRTASPMFLNTSDTESPEYQHGLARLAELLRSLGVEHVHQVDRDQRGHRVSIDPETLHSIMQFLHKHLDHPPKPD